MGGSLTRSAEGRLQTLQTHRMHPSPQAVQQVWTNSTRRRYPQLWEGQPLEAVGHTLEWEPREIACGSCGQPLGKYVAYRVVYATAPELRGERGIVEQTSRHYEPQAETARGQAGSRGPRAKPRFWLEGESGHRAAKTRARFRCPGCHREHRRNLARLGDQLFESKPNAAYLLE